MQSRPQSASRRRVDAGAVAMLMVICSWITVGMCAAEPAEEPPPATTEQEDAAPRLDLKPAPVTELLPAALPAPAAGESEPSVADVEVTETRLATPASTPEVPPGIFAIFWALGRPLDSWRIFVPMGFEQAARFNQPPDATDPYRPPAVPPTALQPDR